MQRYERCFPSLELHRRRLPWKLHCDFNYISVRSFILSGAPLGYLSLISLSIFPFPRLSSGFGSSRFPTTVERLVNCGAGQALLLCCLRIAFDLGKRPMARHGHDLMEAATRFGEPPGRCLAQPMRDAALGASRLANRLSHGSCICDAMTSEQERGEGQALGGINRPALLELSDLILGGYLQTYAARSPSEACPWRNGAGTDRHDSACYEP